ncbi:MAG: hypothetical protein D6B25_16825 [Desulfobulbaceae bacterium]|nr:MAG: hypothetical protein D6B25_16825 [Desulfobulbaceae bacterium]
MNNDHKSFSDMVLGTFLFMVQSEHARGVSRHNIDDSVIYDARYGFEPCSQTERQSEGIYRGEPIQFHT